MKPIKKPGVLLLGICLTLFLTACTPTEPTDTVTTTASVDGSSTTTRYLSDLEGTTTTPIRENTQGDDKATIPPNTATTCVTYAEKKKVFTSLTAYADFVKTVDEQELQSIFEKKEWDGSMYFDKEKFQIILQDRQYLLPTIPPGYTFKRIKMYTLDPLAVILERDGVEYYTSCFMSREEKFPGVEEDDTFFKQDGTKVTVDTSPSISGNAGGGTCYWEESGYQCFIRFTKENKEQVWDFVKVFKMQIVSIA